MGLETNYGGKLFGGIRDDRLLEQLNYQLILRQHYPTHLIFLLLPPTIVAHFNIPGMIKPTLVQGLGLWVVHANSLDQNANATTDGAIKSPGPIYILTLTPIRLQTTATVCFQIFPS